LLLSLGATLTPATAGPNAKAVLEEFFSKWTKIDNIEVVKARAGWKKGRKERPGAALKAGMAAIGGEVIVGGQPGAAVLAAGVAKVQVGSKVIHAKGIVGTLVVPLLELDFPEDRAALEVAIREVFGGRVELKSVKRRRQDLWVINTGAGTVVSSYGKGKVVRRAVLQRTSEGKTVFRGAAANGLLVRFLPF
jgi:hypothetical protein